jgi:hypothetical protein
MVKEFGLLGVHVSTFTERGGIGKAVQIFGDRLTPLMEELTEALPA